MFGIGMPEMLMILGVALVVIGPKKLPELATSLGEALGELKRASRDIGDQLKEASTGQGTSKNRKRSNAGKRQKKMSDKKSAAHPGQSDSPLDTSDTTPLMAANSGDVPQQPDGAAH